MKYWPLFISQKSEALEIDRVGIWDNKKVVRFTICENELLKQPFISVKKEQYFYNGSKYIKNNFYTITLDINQQIANNR